MILTPGKPSDTPVIYGPNGRPVTSGPYADPEVSVILTSLLQETKELSVIDAIAKTQQLIMGISDRVCIVILQEHGSTLFKGGNVNGVDYPKLRQGGLDVWGLLTTVRFKTRGLNGGDIQNLEMEKYLEPDVFGYFRNLRRFTDHDIAHLRHLLLAHDSSPENPAFFLGVDPDITEGAWESLERDVQPFYAELYRRGILENGTPVAQPQCSPLSRDKQSMDALGFYTPDEDVLLGERIMFEPTGLTIPQIEQHFPEIARQIRNDEPLQGVGIEPEGHLDWRTEVWAKGVLERRRHKKNTKQYPHIAAGHQTVIQSLVRRCNGFTKKNLWGIHIPLNSVTVLVLSQQRRQIIQSTTSFLWKLRESFPYLSHSSLAPGKLIIDESCAVGPDFLEIDDSYPGAEIVGVALRVGVGVGQN